MSRTSWAAVAVLLAACGGGKPAPRPEPEPEPGPAYRATVRWTSYGVPHVIADDLAGAGFGQGWASARQHLCRLADQFVRVRGERSSYFGPGDGDSNLDSDFFHLHLGLDARARDLAGRQSKDAHDIARGWVAGYNHYLATTGPSEWPDPCRGAEWVKPIDEIDLARLGLGLASIASSRQFLQQIARAAPDGATAALPPAAPAASPASNGWALGADRTESGHGLIVANPHFPWEGDLTFSEIHLTVRGDFDVYGAGIPGVPMVGIGFTRHHAWTHTFSSSTRFLLYRLRLVDGDPLRYVRDDGEARIVARTYTLEVLQPDGSREKVTRTLHRSEHGPMIASALTPWSAASGAGFAFGDVALDSAGSATDLYLGFARAESLEGFRAALAHRATPFLNTIYADVEGHAWYVDGSAVPHLSDEALAAWELGKKAVPEIAAAWRLGVPVVDGSSSLFDLVVDDPQAPGAIPIGAAPELLRSDFVFNANDSYGYTNPAEPMTGYSPLYGAAEAAPSSRSLMNLRALREKGVAAGSGPDGRFSRAEATAAMLSNRSFTGEQLRDDVLARCTAEAQRRAGPKPTKKQKGKRRQGPDAALLRLCQRLAEWDVRFDVASRGAVLWREFVVDLGASGGVPWAIGFDHAALSTPSGLAPHDKDAFDPVILHLEQAAKKLAAAGIDLAAGNPTLGELQRAGSEPVPGGIGADGVGNVVTWVDWNGTLLPRTVREPAISPSGLGKGGYPINYGTSWVMAVDLQPAGPDAQVLMTYGPSRDPDGGGSQLALFATGTLRAALFEDEEIRADPNLSVDELTSEETAR